MRRQINSDELNELKLSNLLQLHTRRLARN